MDDVPRRRERPVVGGVGPDDLDQRQHRDGVEEVEADDPFGVGEPDGHRRDGERRGVRRKHAVRRHHRFERGEHLSLRAELLEHRLEDEVAARVRVRPVARHRERPEHVGLRLRQTPAGNEPVELAADRLDCAGRPLGVDVGEDDRDPEPAHEQRRELRRHQPCADDPDPLDPPRLGVGDGRRPCEPALHDVEGIERRLRLGPGKQLGDRVLLRSVPLLETPRGSALDQLERSVRRWSLAVHGIVDPGPRPTHHLGGVREIGLGATLAGARLDRLQQQLQRSVEQRLGPEDVVDEPELERRLCADHAVLPQRVLDDEADGGLGADEARRELRPAPGRDQPQEDLGKAQVPDVGADRPDVAVEGQLEPATERSSVDRSKRLERQPVDAAEQLVAGATPLPRSLGRDLWELGDVGARPEASRAARDEEPPPVACPQAPEHLVQRPKRRLAERVRPVRPTRSRSSRRRPDRRASRAARGGSACPTCAGAYRRRD